jgi:hypothetical protein
MSTNDEKISSLYHEAGKPVPSKSLDDAILGASREAVDKPASTRVPFSGSWPAAVSIAAVIVITIILVPVLKQQEPQQTLTEATRDKSSLPGASDETDLNAYRSTALRKKSMDAPSPASAPAMLPEVNDLAADQAMPDRSSVSSPAATAPATGLASASEKEEMQLESDASAIDSSIMQAADSAPFAILTPEMWQVKITRLITEGKMDEAQAEVERLEQHYPEHIIDPNLLEKLK